MKKQLRSTPRGSGARWARDRRHIDAILDTVSLTDEVPDALPRLADLARAIAGRLEPYRGGRRAGHVAWHDAVRELVEQEDLSFPPIWARLRRLAAEDHDVIVDVVASNADPACANIPGRAHPEKHHLHWRDRNRDDRVFAVSAGTVKNFVSKLRRSAK